MNLEQCVMIAELVASLGVVVSIVYLAVQVRTRSTCARASALSRGSCTSGLRANGAILPGLEYRAMIGNNLSQLGVHGTFSTEDRQAQPDTEGEFFGSPTPSSPPSHVDLRGARVGGSVVGGNLTVSGGSTFVGGGQGETTEYDNESGG